MSDVPLPFTVSKRPIEITEESFSIHVGSGRSTQQLASGLLVPKDSLTGELPQSSWHMAKEATDLPDDAVSPDQLEALRWLRAKRGRIDFGKSYGHQDAQGLRVQVPQRPVTIEFPYCGLELTKPRYGVVEFSGTTLVDAVAAATAALVTSDPGDTYPDRDLGFDRVLAKIGDAEVRVSDLMALIRDYYEDHCTGGSLHCVLDDANLEDGHVDYGIRYSREQNDSAAVLIGTLLRLMPEGERLRLRERGYGK